MPIYAGVGSRETPDHILKLMEDIAVVLAQRGWVLRSGLAEGADQAFHVGATMANGQQENYIPWKRFNGANAQAIVAPDLPNWEDVLGISSHFHPAWDKCSEGAKKLHGRNLYQIVGKNLDLPVDCVVCWTKNGQEIGGTAQAMRIAKHLEIPIFNLFFDDHINKLNDFVLQME